MSEQGRFVIVKYIRLHGCQCPVNELDMLVSAKTMLDITLHLHGHLQLSRRVSKGTIASDGPATKRLIV